MTAALLLTLLQPSADLARAGEVPRVAVLYSSYPDGTSAYRDEYDEVLARLGWPHEEVENTHLTQLMERLDDTELLIGATGFNQEHPQDLTPYANQIARFVRYGGLLLLTDANHDSHVGWLPTVEPRLAIEVSAQPCPVCAQGEAWADLRHPLLAGIEPLPRVEAHPSRVSGLCQVLVRGPCGGPILTVRELGDGLIVATALSRTDGFPDIAFLQNLWLWARDEGRIAQAREREEERYRALIEPKELEAKRIEAPVIDGLLDDEAWRQAAQTAQFVLPDNSAVGERETRAFIGLDDYWLYVALRCDGTSATGPDGDYVEVMIDATGRGEPCTVALDSAGAKSGSPEVWWEAAVQRSRRGWAAEIRIALVTLGHVASFAEDWAVSFRRHDAAASEGSVWAPAEDGQPGWGQLQKVVVDASRFPIRANQLAWEEGTLSVSFTKPSYGNFAGRYVVESISPSGQVRETARELRVEEYRSTLVETEHRFGEPGRWRLRAWVEVDGGPVWVSDPITREAGGS